MNRFLTAGLVAGLALSTAWAGEFNKKISVGDAAPVFSKLPTAEGKQVSLADYSDKDVVVIAITCNHCPVAVAYEDRLIAFKKKFGDKVGVVAINVNSGEDDGLPKMKERASEKGFNYPYAIDESQQIGRQLGATVTPEFFVLNKERKVVYMGAFDDSMNAKKVTVNYVEAAVEAVLNGKTPAVKETKARGCGVRYNQGKN